MSGRDRRADAARVKQFSGGVMENQLCAAAAAPTPVVSPLKQGFANAAKRRQIGAKPRSVERLPAKPGLKRNDREPLSSPETGDAREVRPRRSFRRADLAFQRAMRRAVAQGREHPPMIGVFKDARLLEAPRLFEPVPHSSGCTSPALVCAELGTLVDGP